MKNEKKTYIFLVDLLVSLVQYLEDCWRDNDEGDFPKMCILCVCIIINKRVLNLFVFGSCFRTLAVILFQNFFSQQ